MTDKARQLKERTLAIEVKHAQMTGGTFRDAEDANIRNLERLAARQREGKKPAPKATPRQFANREITKKDLEGANVTRRPAPPKKLSAPACRFCGLCRWCKRFKRTQTIMRKAREGDQAMLKLAMELVGLALAEQQRSNYKDGLGREYPFSRLRGHDKTRAINTGVESVCDRSVSYLGAWL